MLPRHHRMTYHHVPGTGTICVLPSIGNPDLVQIGLAFLSQPVYRDANGKRIPYRELLYRFIQEQGFGWSVEAGDVYDHSMGRMISYGRAERVRNHAGIFTKEEADELIAELQELEASMASRPKGAGLLDEIMVEYVHQRAALQQIFREKFSSDVHIWGSL